MWGKKGLNLFVAIILVILQSLGVVAKKLPNKKSTKPALRAYGCDELDDINNLVVKFKRGKNSQLAFASFSRKYKVKNFKFRQVFRERVFADDLDLKDYYQMNINDELLASYSKIKGLTSDETTVINRCEAIQNLISEMNSRIDVELAEPDFKAKISAEITDTFFNSSGSWGQGYDDQWALKKIEAEKAWTISEGQKAIVAVVDTGVDYNHPDLWNNIWVNPEYASDRNRDGKLNLDDLDLNGNKRLEDSELIPGAIGIDFANNDYNPLDDQGHGTHLAGIIAASKNDKGIVGVAPQAKILIIKAMDRSGYANYSNLIKAIVYAAKYADVANNSWTGLEDSNILRKAFLKASKQGLISVAAAGNSNTSSPGYPAAFTESVIGVASTTVNDSKSEFSNYGSYVTIAAPGGGETTDDKYLYRTRNILSTIASNSAYSTYREYLLQEDDSSYYLRLAGTSMATGYVTGVIALLKSMNSNITVAAAKQYLTSYGDNIGTAKYGFSKRVNAYKTVYYAKTKPINFF